MMKTILNVSILAVLLVVAPSSCFAMWGVAPVSMERAKEWGMEIHAKAAGPNDVRVQLELEIDGRLENFSRVEMRIGARKKPSLRAALKEDRSRPGHIVVSFAADRTTLDQIELWVMVRDEPLGGTAYEIDVQDFVDLEELR